MPKISELPAATAAPAVTDQFVVVQSGTTRRITRELADAHGFTGAVVYAEDFGANPNGSFTDNAAAINAAILAASQYSVAGQLRGGVVQLLKGTYLINETILLRSLVELRGISQTATTIEVPGGTNIRAIQTVDTDQILYGVRSFGIYGHASQQSEPDDGSPSMDTGGIYLLNAKAEPTAIGQYRFLGGCRSWAQDILIQEVAGNGLMIQGNSGWMVRGVQIQWARRYGFYIDANDGSFEQLIASRTGWAGLFVDGSSSRYSDIKVWFTGVEMDGWANARSWAQANDTTAYNRQFADAEKAGCGVLVRGDHNRLTNVDVQDTAGHGAFFHCRFTVADLRCDQIGQVNSGGTTTRYDGGGAGAYDWVDLNPGKPLCGVRITQNQRGHIRAHVGDINYNTDGTPGGNVLWDVLAHLASNNEPDLSLDVTGFEEIMEQHSPPTDPVVSSSPYTLNGVAGT
jgi:hypothetical protein